MYDIMPICLCLSTSLSYGIMYAVCVYPTQIRVKYTYIKITIVVPTQVGVGAA